MTTLSIFDMDWGDTGQIPALVPVETITRRLIPSPRRPEATGEQPVYHPQTIGVIDPANIARIWAPAPVTYGPPADPPRKSGYRGLHRRDRRRERSVIALLSARRPAVVR